MRFAISLFAGAMLLAAPGLAATEQNPKAAAELARALEGRVAGEPVDCIRLQDIRSSRIIDGTAILYETNGGTIYVNRPDSGARFLDKWDVLVTKTSLSQLCSIDIVRLVDPSARMETGSVGLGKFVPYTKVKKKAGG